MYLTSAHDPDLDASRRTSAGEKCRITPSTLTRWSYRERHRQWREGSGGEEGTYPHLWTFQELENDVLRRKNVSAGVGPLGTEGPTLRYSKLRASSPLSAVLPFSVNPDIEPGVGDPLELSVDMVEMAELD